MLSVFILILMFRVSAADQPTSSEAIPAEETVVNEDLQDESALPAKTGTIVSTTDNESENAIENTTEEQVPENGTPVSDNNVVQTESQDGTSDSARSYFGVFVACAVVIGIILYLTLRRKR